MSNTFSLNRIKLLLRADWIEHHARISFHIGAVIAGMVVYFLIALNSAGNINPERKQFLAFIFGFIGTLIYYCRYIGSKIHQPKGLFLTLPANTIEKYAVLLIEGILIVLLYQFTFWIGLYAISLFIPNFPVMNVWVIQNNFPLSIGAFVFSLLFLSFVTFRKHAFVIAICGYAVFITGLVGLIYVLSGMINGDMPCEINFFAEMNPFMNTVSFLGKYYVYMFSSATLVVFYIAYLKLKEKELR